VSSQSPVLFIKLVCFKIIIAVDFEPGNCFHITKFPLKPKVLVQPTTQPNLFFFTESQRRIAMCVRTESIRLTSWELTIVDSHLPIGRVSLLLSEPFAYTGNVQKMETLG